MTLASTLFPRANRQAAIVAFLRTVQQVLKGTGLVGTAGYVIVTSTQLVHLDLQTVGIAAGAIALSAILSGMNSAFNILANGLPTSYTAPADVTPVVPVAAPVAPVVPVDPATPAA